jgi:uncharacterized membrane protein
MMETREISTSDRYRDRSSLWDRVRTPEGAFLVFALVFGLLFLLVYPPIQPPDEPAHFFRTYQLSQGQLIADGKNNGAGGMIPKSIIQLTAVWGNLPFRPNEKVNFNQFIQSFRIPLNPQDAQFTTIMSSIYSPVPYIPQIIGITIAKLLNLSPILMLYLGRFCNLIATTVLAFFAIKIVPEVKWVFFLLALTPMAISQRASLSADATLYSVAFLLIAVLLNCAFNPEKEKMTWRDILWIALLSVTLSLSKQVYFLVPFLSFLIPVEKFGDRKRYWQSCLLIVAGSTLAWLLWSLVLRGVGLPTNPFLDTSVSRQIHYLLTYPFTVFSTAWNTLQGVDSTIAEFIGVLGWLDTHIPMIITISYASMLVFVALVSHGPQLVLSGANKLKVFFILAATIFLVYLSQYLIWTAVGASKVNGVQGRYMIPISPLFFLMFYSDRISFRISERSFYRVNVYFVLFALVSSLIATMERYYKLV